MESGIKNIDKYQFGMENLTMGDLNSPRRVKLNKPPKSLKFNVFPKSETFDTTNLRNQIKIAKTVRPTLMPKSEKIIIPVSDHTTLTRGDDEFANFVTIDYKNMHSIPCLCLPPPRNSDKIILYFHANAEDIKQAQQLCSFINIELNVNFLIF